MHEWLPRNLQASLLLTPIDAAWAEHVGVRDSTLEARPSGSLTTRRRGPPSTRRAAAPSARRDRSARRGARSAAR